MIDITPELLRVARTWARLSHRALAQRIGVSVWRIWRIENQISPMRMSEREALLRALPLLAKLDEREREHDGA